MLEDSEPRVLDAEIWDQYRHPMCDVFTVLGKLTVLGK